MRHCPVPDKWSAIHAALTAAARERDLPLPPAPPGEARDVQDPVRFARWSQTVVWSLEHGLEDLVPPLAPGDTYTPPVDPTLRLGPVPDLRHW